MRKDDDAKEGGIKAKAKGDEGRGAVGAVAKVMEGVVVVAMVAKVMEGVVVVAKVMNGVCIGECFGVRTTRPKSSEQEIVVLAVATVFVERPRQLPQSTQEVGLRGKSIRSGRFYARHCVSKSSISLY